MDILQTIKDHIEKETADGLRNADEIREEPPNYSIDYYRGYYNGVLTELYNIKAIITKGEQEE